MLLAGCSTVCTTVAEAAKMWNLIVVSFIVNYRIFSLGEFIVYTFYSFYYQQKLFLSQKEFIKSFTTYIVVTVPKNVIAS